MNGREHHTQNGASGALFRHLWSACMDVLERYLNHMDPSTPTKKKTKKTRPDREPDKGEIK
jgi:hypothetical protein